MVVPAAIDTMIAVGLTACAQLAIAADIINGFTASIKISAAAATTALSFVHCTPSSDNTFEGPDGLLT